MTVVTGSVSTPAGARILVTPMSLLAAAPPAGPRPAGPTVTVTVAGDGSWSVTVAAGIYRFVERTRGWQSQPYIVAVPDSVAPVPLTDLVAGPVVLR